MKSILNKIEFHYTYVIMAFGLIITGHFINLVIFTSIIIIHELGHIITSKMFKYEIDKVVVYPHGGLTKVNKLINTDINNDIIVAISGIIMQTTYFILVLFLYKNNFIREYTYNLFYLYHKSILLFNILPIIPLDGSKLLNLIFSKYLNYNLSNKLTIVISFFTIIFFLFSNMFDKNYSIIMVIGVFLNNIYRFYKELSYIYNKFLLERYLYDFNYFHYKFIKDRNKMYKNKLHYIKYNNDIYDEKEYLGIFFHKK